MVSSAPDCSPASTKLQNKSSKCSGFFRIELAKLLPPSTSDLMSMIRSRRLALSSPSATISNAETKGTPAFIMVANWRLKIAMSPGVILDRLAPPIPNRGSDFFLTFGLVTPCLRSSALIRAMLVPIISPLALLPFRSRPCH